MLLFRLPKIKEFVDKNDPGAMIIPFSGAFEAKFLEMDEEARKAFCEETKCSRWDFDFLSIYFLWYDKISKGRLNERQQIGKLRPCM